MEVTLQDLQAYRALKAAIRGLEEEINTTYKASPSPPEVRGGKSSVPSPGDPTRIKAMKIVALRERLQEKVAEYESMTDRIDAWVETIEEPEIAQIIRLHYIQGYSWNKTCMVMYGYHDRDYCRKMISRYFKKLSALSAS